MPDLTFEGGLNENSQLDINPSECFEGENFALRPFDRTLRRRGVQQLITTAANAATVTGILQLTKRDATTTTLVAAGTNVYTFASPTSSTVVDTITSGAKLRGDRKTHYWGLDDFLVVTDVNKVEPVNKWDGTTWSRLKTTLTSGTTTTVTIEQTGGTATVTHTAHGFSSKDLVTIAGAVETEYNGHFEITVTTANEYTYALSGSPSSPATGTITSDKAPNLHAKYAAVKDGRLWLFNITDGSNENPHMMLASAFEDAENFDTAVRSETTAAGTTAAFFILTPDLREINGVVEFQNQLIISTEKGHLYKLSGSDSSDYRLEQLYAGSSATGTETMVSIGNDVIYMKQGGSFELLSSVEQFGDVKADDVGRFLTKTVEKVTDCVAIYSEDEQTAYFFIPGKCIVFYKDAWLTRPQLSPWSVWTTQLSDTFRHGAAAVILNPDSVQGGFLSVWGDAIGRVFKMNGESEDGDAGTTAINTIRRSPNLVLDTYVNNNVVGRVHYYRRGICTLLLRGEFSDSFANPEVVLKLKGGSFTDDGRFWGDPENFWSESKYWREGTVTGDDIGGPTHLNFDLTGRGRQVAIEIEVNERPEFEIQYVTIDRPI